MRDKIFKIFLSGCLLLGVFGCDRSKEYDYQNLIDVLNSNNNNISVEYIDSFNYKVIYYDDENKTINFQKSNSIGDEDTFIELIVNTENLLEGSYIKYVHTNLNNIQEYCLSANIKFSKALKEKYVYEANNVIFLQVDGYKKEEEIPLMEANVNNFFNEFEDYLEEVFDTNWKGLGFKKS